ncbi:hypothetical protein NEF87_005064 [Candidatus Lokiarchaeum ossiferum]|uniref:Phosphotyrosine protein phosphatase I domain-containing protein n=1 Tax=Candidatus Lokiarchaeum ossiferum TaxID=2951803 RepID=A0ABY6I279_9ARCH|nr:hypothetical protein NEF87_005064 [Candidatus Lokiarchaeum sp. B-35]
MEIPQKVLVICYGNICRSPVAEYMLKYYLKNSTISALKSIEIRSAGLDPSFREMSLNSQRYLEKKNIGLDIQKFSSTKISKDLVQESDIIYVLEQYMKDTIISRFGKNNIEESNFLKNGKVQTLSEGASLSGDVEDPYGMDYHGYEVILDKINNLCKQIVKNWEIIA